ncbi:biopolymer transporter ExbB [Rhodovulum sp. FJ3]|uniref:biopolymer transporter ExbB n=1 Tax=Rhodovulum sp. FJ3 TaxID=3079053 RepID=UPI00293DDA12|nr:biopolymer transporter ExbB [Rhodovulum sp. FJ3]MDV4167102.1 biopolymer transporter ExbB [Rhodovulum sp. FJ3]
MDMTDHEAEPHFSQPVRQIFLMLVALGLFSFGGYIALPRVAPVFLANPYLNGLIAAVFLAGVLACILQMVQLISSVRWIERFSGKNRDDSKGRAPRLLAPLAALLGNRQSRMHISASSAGSILESVATRIEEARDITRYIVNLLIFLGLLGTFYGLATTVPAVVETIRSLAPTEGEDSVAVFSRLMTGLEAQLGGMGTAFASSLLGLAGSLVVGLLELFAGHGQNRFYRELEEWLSTFTRIGFAGAEGEGANEMGAVAAVMEQMSLQMDALQTIVANSEANRDNVEGHLAQMTATLDRVAGQLEGNRDLDQAIAQLAAGQDRLATAIEAIAGEGGSAHSDAESRMRLRSIDVQLLRILEEISAGRQEAIGNLRADLSTLNQTIRRATGAED